MVTHRQLTLKMPVSGLNPSPRWRVHRQIQRSKVAISLLCKNQQTSTLSEETIECTALDAWCGGNLASIITIVKRVKDVWPITITIAPFLDGALQGRFATADNTSPFVVAILSSLLGL
jgi:hypothetical protein